MTGLLENLLKRLFFVSCLLLLSGLIFSPVSSQTVDTGTYYQAEFNATVNPVTASYIERAISRAERDGAGGLIIRLDTPGGLLDSTKSITDRILNADVPVLVWVGPGGARATSAGVFITYSAHRAGMAEGTNIGAAHPVQGGGQQGEMGETMKEKVVNDAVAQLTGLARKRGRNEVVAEQFIRESVSLNAREAHDTGAVDVLANDVDDFINQVAGQSVELENGRTVVLPDNGDRRELAMTWKEDFLNTIVNPNLVYILLMLGMYGLIYEFSNPGVGLGLVVGGICLLLGMFGMSMLPISYTGLGLIILGMALMILDIFVPTFGVLTMGGLVSFVLGSVMLFQTQAFAVSYGLIAGVTAATVVFLLVVGYLVMGSFYEPVAIGDDSLVGRHGTVKERLDPEGMVYVWGEYWNAVSEDRETIETGDEVTVVEKRNRQLVVEPRVRDGSTDSA